MKGEKANEIHYFYFLEELQRPIKREGRILDQGRGVIGNPNELGVVNQEGMQGQQCKEAMKPSFARMLHGNLRIFFYSSNRLIIFLLSYLSSL